MAAGMAVSGQEGFATPPRRGTIPGAQRKVVSDIGARSRVPGQ